MECVLKILSEVRRKEGMREERKKKNRGHAWLLNILPLLLFSLFLEASCREKESIQSTASTWISVIRLSCKEQKPVGHFRLAVFVSETMNGF